MQASFSELEYATKQKQTRRDRFLAQIEAVTPWDALTQVIAPHYPSSGGRGRPPVGLERMLRMYVAQQCFGLSDEGIEGALYDSQAIRRFVGMDIGPRDSSRGHPPAEIPPLTGRALPDRVYTSMRSTPIWQAKGCSCAKAPLWMPP